MKGNSRCYAAGCGHFAEDHVATLKVYFMASEVYKPKRGFVCERCDCCEFLPPPRFGSTEQRLVAEFHEAFGVPILQKPACPPRDRLALRVALLREEVEEFAEAAKSLEMVMDGRILPSYILLANVARELADVLYVAHGAALEFGIDLAPVFAEVHRANMSKQGADGKVVKDERGKVLKPPGFVAPDIESIIREQMIGKAWVIRFPGDAKS